MRRFLIPSVLWGPVISLSARDCHQALHVLRLSVGDTILIFDGDGLEVEARLEQLDARSARAIPLGPPRERARGLKLVLGQGLPKAEKLETILQHGTELGLTSAWPLQLARSIPRLPPEREARKIERWRRIVGEASRQSRRSDVPEIQPVGSLEAFLDAFAHARARAVGLLPDEEASAEPRVRDVLAGLGGAPAGGVWMVVGPEGGLTRAEVALAVGAGFVRVSLGSRTLRTETAALAMLALAGQLLE